MRQKYVIQKTEDHRELVVQEYAELDKDILSFICEERHDLSRIDAAVEKGRAALIAQLRTDNMYPPIHYAQAIADAIIQKMEQDGALEHEIVFDDSHFITKDQQRAEAEQDLEEEEGEIDDLLDEDLDDDYDDKKMIKEFKSSIKIAEDDGLDLDEDA